MSHANGLSPFRGKVNRFIIPIRYFNGRTSVTSTLQKIEVTKPLPEYVPKKKDQVQAKKTQQEKKEAFSPPKIKIEKAGLGNTVSSLSLSSIELKKEAERKSSSKKIKVNHSQESFSQETLLVLWKAYIKEKNTLGENNIAALLEMSQPELQADHKIVLRTSSSLSKAELTKELTPLLAHLNQTLNNYKITFEIKIEARKSEEYVYGVKDKYEYLKKLNPDIEVLKKEFDLDL